MSDLQQAPANDANPKLEPTEVKPGQLPLLGDAPATVYVSLQNGVPAFSSTVLGTAYTGGLAWTCGEYYSKFVKLVLLPGITGTYCPELPYSSLIAGPGNPTQDLAIARKPVYTTVTCTVTHTGGSTNVIVIITPITDPGATG